MGPRNDSWQWKTTLTTKSRRMLAHLDFVGWSPQKSAALSAIESENEAPYGPSSFRRRAFTALLSSSSSPLSFPSPVRRTLRTKWK